jgi:beta-glucosidase
VLTGKVNPSGKLPVSIPKHVGQLPVHSTVRAYGRGMYVDLGPTPAYPLGFGLSYTTFGYSNLRCGVGTMSAAFPTANSAEPACRQAGGTASSMPHGADDLRITVSVDVKNTGSRAGDEVVQLYLTDEVASVILPPKMLKGFQRTTLQPGQSRTVEFTLAASDMAVLDADMNWTVEPGTFKVGVRGLETAFSVGRD